MPVDTFEQRRELCGMEATLDGERAKIVGARCDFATVRSFTDPARSASFAWHTVERILTDKGGKFRT